MRLPPSSGRDPPVFFDCLRRVFECPVAPWAWARTIPLPACACTDQRSGSSPSTNAATDRRTNAGDETDRPVACRLKLGQCVPERRRVGALDDREIVAPQLGLELVELPSHRRRIVFDSR